MSDVASFAREKRQTQTTLKIHQFKPLTNLSQPPVNGVVMANELLKTEFLITKTVTKMSPMDMLSTEQGIDLRKGQVRYDHTHEEERTPFFM